MGYEYLVKVARNDPRYLLVDGRNDSLRFLGTKDAFSRVGSSASASSFDVPDEMFAEADEFGSTDERMYWEKSTYITFDAYALLRSQLVDFANTCNDYEGALAVGFIKAAKLHAVEYARVDNFGAVSLVEIVLACERNDIPLSEFENFERRADLLAPLTPKSNRISGPALFRTAKALAEASGVEVSADAPYEEIFGWARFLGLLFSVADEYSLHDQSEKGQYPILYTWGEDFLSAGWRNGVRMLDSIRRNVPLEQNRLHYVLYEIADFGTAWESYGEALLDYLDAGVFPVRNVKRLIKNGVSADFAASITERV